MLHGLQIFNCSHAIVVGVSPRRISDCSVACHTSKSQKGRPQLRRSFISKAVNGPSDPQPSYEQIDSLPLNRVVYGLFRKKMVAALNSQDSMEAGYPAIIDLTRRLNSLGSPRETQETTRKILKSLFPSWLPGAFKVMFAKPFPDLSCRLNAWATWLTCQWLMGECEINAVDIDGGDVRDGYGVLVKRCRYLEESGCVGICINSCKVPTQEFFEKDMGLPLTMEPNYETFECQFSFGKTPPSLSEDEALQAGCFTKCPTTRLSEEQCPRVERVP